MGLRLEMPAFEKARHEIAKAKLTEGDKKLARVLFTTERMGDAKIGLDERQVPHIPPIYEMLASALRDPTNRAILHDLLEEKVE